MKRKLIFTVIAVLIVVVSVVCNIEKKWDKDKLERSKFNNSIFENYITAEVTTKNITEKSKKLEILLKKTEKKELRSINTYLIMEVYLSGEWYVIPKISSNYMLEESMNFTGKEYETWLDLRSFEMRPGRYRVLVPYYIEGNQTRYYTTADFTCE